MRQLPEEENAEEDPGAQRDVAARCRPPRHGRERAGHRAHQRAERRPPLERRVREQIEDRRGRGDQRNDGANQRREVCRPEHRERDAEQQRLQGLETAGGQRPGSGAIHPRVDVPLPVLIESQRPARGEQGADQKVDHAEIVGRPRQPHVVAHERRDENHDEHPRLRERHEIRRHLAAVASDEGDDDFGAGFAHTLFTVLSVRSRRRR